MYLSDYSRSIHTKPCLNMLLTCCAYSCDILILTGAPFLSMQSIARLVHAALI